MFNATRAFFIFTFLFTISAITLAQMPPHPELKKKIRSGEIENPMSDINELRAKGIDAPWADEELKLQKQSNNGMLRTFGPAVAPTGKIKTLTILVTFSDQPAKTPATYFDSLLYSANGATVNNYFKEISYNTVEIAAEDLPSKIGWVMAPHPYSYYVGTGKGEGTYPENSQGLVEDVVRQIDSFVDFSKYDNDGNGVLEALFIVHTGPGSEFTGNAAKDIWSHAWSTKNTTVLDGTQIKRYSIEPEYMIKPNDMTCGVFAHELGHAAFGLPDLYDVDNSSEGLGNWSLMAGGSWNGSNGNSPAHPDAWSRIQMGFGKATDIRTNSYGLKLPSMKDTAVIYRVWKNGIAGKEYFLLENREKANYDKGLPGQGLLIYHVDENVIGSNTNEWYPGHTSTGHFKVALEQADGLFDLEKSTTNRGDGGDAFPGSTGNRNFTATTLPNSMDYSSSNNYLGVRNISNPQSVMTMDIDLTDYLSTSRLSLDFGTKEVSTKSDTLTISIKNNGPSAAAINKLEVKNQQFKLITVAALPQNIAAGASVNVKLQYIPSAAGITTDSLLIYSDPQKPPMIVSLAGKGYIIASINKTTMYGCLASSGKGSVITIDSSTGSAVEIGNPGYSELKALTISRTKNELLGLYVSGATSKILRVNAQLGDAYEFLTTDSILTAIALDNNDRLYGASANGNVYTINTANGHCTLTATTGLAIQSIAINPSNNFIYAGVGASSDVVKDKIYKINKDNGDTLFIGRTGFNVFTNGITFDGNGNCFGSKGTALQIGQIFKIDAATAAGTLIGSIGLKGIKGIALYPGSAISGVNNDKENSVIRKFFLEQNYPNPFNPATNIEFSVPEVSHVLLKVYDILGKEVATLVDEVKSAGGYTVSFNSEKAYALSSGIYFYRIQAGSFSDIKKMIIIK